MAFSMGKFSKTSVNRSKATPAPASHCSDYFEDLLDRLARVGMLGEEEWGHLQAHVAQCLPCGMQLRSPVHFQSARPLSASAADAQLDRRAIQAVMLRSDDRSRRPVARLSFVRRWVPIAVGTLLLSGTTLAATWWSTHREPELVVGGGPEPQSPGQPMARGASRRAAPPASAAFDPAAAPTPGSVPKPAPSSGWGELSSMEGAPAARPRFAPPRRSASATAVTEATIATERAAAARLFARARHERVSGQIDQALGTYQRLQRGFPDSRECRLSYLVAGRLWLQRDRADLAAAQFRLYLDSDPGGGASEEALLGHASALDRMGHFSEEAHDWRLLLTEHPGSIYARRARVRLDALETKQARRSGSTSAEPRLSP